MTRLQTHVIHQYLILLLLLPSYVAAQDNFFGNSGEKFTPYTIIIIIIAIIFALTAFLSIILRNFSQGCFGLNVVPANPSLTADGCPSARGLKPEVINSLPTYFYSDVKKHRNGKVELECAVCLSEFLDVEALRLLPGCNHVFHPRCIDKWLSSHVTCPICRQNLESGPCPVKKQDEYSINLSVTHDEPDGSHHAIICRDHHEEEKETKKRNIVVGKFPRSHSTGHSLGDSERFTLMLPEGVVNNTVMNRSNSNDGGELLTSMFSPRSGYRCGWFSTSMPSMHSMSGSVLSTISTGVVAGGSKKVIAPPVKTSERLWPI